MCLDYILQIRTQDILVFKLYKTTLTKALTSVYMRYEKITKKKNDDAFCILCNQKNFQIILDLGYTKLVKCRNDGLISIVPLLQKGEISKKNILSKFNLRKYNLLYESKKKEYYNDIKNLEKIGKKGKLLDIGCGNGNFLRVARILGWETYGIEPNLFNAIESSKYASVKFGKMREDSFKENYFDVITCHSMFYYVEKPLVFLNNIKKMLKPKGIIVIKPIPNVDSFYAKMNIFQLLKSYPPGKVYYYFSTKTINLLVKKAGLKVMSSTTSGLGTFTKNRIKIEKNSDKPKKYRTKSKRKNKFKDILRFSTNHLKFYNHGSSISLILTKD